MNKGKIFHLVPTARWEKALIEGRYQPESLKKEGFIHFSTWEQLHETAELYYKEEKSLEVLFVIEKHVKQNLKWEKSRDDQDFPHLYGGFPFSAVETTRKMIRNAAGKFEIEEE